MKWTALPGLTALLLLLWVGPVFALSYTDYMKDLDSNSFKSYANLQPLATSAVPQAVQAHAGQMAVTFANAQSPRAYAQYRVWGAERIEVAIYTPLGTFVAPMPGAEDVYAAGATGSNMSYVQSATKYPLMLGDNGMCYAAVGGNLRMLAYYDNQYQLMPPDAAVPQPGSLSGYGLNVYAVEGSSKRQISMTRTGVTVTGSYVYEEFSGVPPAGAGVIQVEINDFSSIGYIPEGGAMRYSRLGTGMTTVLKQVTFTGADLVVGEPEPMDSAPQGSGAPQSDSHAAGESERGESSKSSSKASSKSASGRAAAAGGGAAGGAGSASPREKFEGEVTSIVPGASTGGGAAGGGVSAAAPAGTEPQSTLPESSQPSREDWEDSRIVRLSPTRSGGTLPAATIYVVVMAALLLVLLLGRGGKK